MAKISHDEAPKPSIARWLPLILQLVLIVSAVAFSLYAILRNPPLPPGVQEALARMDQTQRYFEEERNLVERLSGRSPELGKALWKHIQAGRASEILPQSVRWPSSGEEALTYLLRSGVDIGATVTEKDEFLAYMKQSYPAYPLEAADVLWTRRLELKSPATSAE